MDRLGVSTLWRVGFRRGGHAVETTVSLAIEAGEAQRASRWIGFCMAILCFVILISECDVSGGLSGYEQEYRPLAGMGE